MNVDGLPLLALFYRLRQEVSVPPDIDEYLLLLRALEDGFACLDRATLKRLCRMLWVKSVADGQVFDDCFEELIPQMAEPLPQYDEPVSFPSSTTPPSDEAIAPDSSPSVPETPPSEEGSTEEGSSESDAEGQVLQAVLQMADEDDAISVGKYISSDEYFSVTRRQMKQSWRYLRRWQRVGPPVELDIDATVQKIARQGMFLEPVLLPRRKNQAELLLLIDYGGSMVPFHMLAQRLHEAAVQGGHLRKVGVYYFYNYPAKVLYHTPAQLEYDRVEDVLDGRYSRRTGVLIFSDAGAARGGFNRKRITATENFLDRFKQQFRYIAWLNPMPSSRWSGTTAGSLMHTVPMFDLESRRSLDDAISVLRGRSSHLAYPLRSGYYG